MHPPEKLFHDIFISYKHFESEGVHAQNNPNKKKYTQSLVDMIKAETDQLLTSELKKIKNIDLSVTNKKVSIWMDNRMEIIFQLKKHS